MNEAQKCHLNLTGPYPVKTPVGIMIPLGKYKNNSSIRYFEFTGFEDHLHIRHDETFYVLGGTGEVDVHRAIPSDGRISGFILGDRLYKKEVSRESVIHVLKGEVHSLIVPSGLTLDVLLIIEPEHDPKDYFTVKPRKVDE